MNQQELFEDLPISEEDWQKTPVSVKKLVQKLEQQGNQTNSELNNVTLSQPSFADSTLTKTASLLVVIPSFNDWDALEKLLRLIDDVAFDSKLNLEVLVVDDYSSNVAPDSLISQKYAQIKSVKVLRLRRNLGHQRAIATGLCYAYHNLSCDWFVVMDGDGEDNPYEMRRFLEASKEAKNQQIIFARRSKRSESSTFKVFYFLYRQLYKLLIGKEIRVGNFSLIPQALLKNVVILSEIWNHYSAGIYHSRIPYLEIDVPRTKRLCGKPKMNMISLVTHGLSSIAVYGDIVGTRILLGVIILSIVFLSIWFVVILVRFLTNWAVPGWATYVSGLIFLLVFQLILTGIIFSMVILSSRNYYNFIPIRDYKYYVDYLYELKL